MFSITIEELLLIFERFNQAIWPFQFVAYILGIVAVFFIFKQTRYSTKIVLAILSFFWLWSGIVFCLMYWVPSYVYAYGFGLLCIIQGLLFLMGVIKQDWPDSPKSRSHFITGIVFVAYAMAGYPILGYFLGHVYPEFIPFGLVPCPTTVFTFGLFLLMNKKFPRYYLVVPFIVAIASLLAVYKGVYEDIGLFLAGLIGIFLILHSAKKVERSQ